MKPKQFFEKYERFLLPGMLIAGVAADFFTFKSISLKTAFIVLSVYLVIAGATIAYTNIYLDKSLEKKGKLFQYLRLISPLIIQFTFGALLSASLIFYWFSGAFSVSWPFIAIIAILMASNDVWRQYYLKPVVQISVYFFILFSLSSLLLPFIFNSISFTLFIASGIISLFIIQIYTEILSKWLGNIKQQKSKIAASVFTIFALMNALYFLNIIPPIPLSIREAGVYHSVTSSGGKYFLQGEEETLFDKITPNQTIHTKPGKRVFVFTAIFAPTDLKTTIVHEWEYYNKEKRKWISDDKLSFSIFGGREEGYRGFSRKTNLKEGLWRVNVETERGQTLGRIKFNVKYVDELPELIKVIK